MPPARVQTRIAWSGDEHTSYEVITSPSELLITNLTQTVYWKPFALHSRKIKDNVRYSSVSIKSTFTNITIASFLAFTLTVLYLFPKSLDPSNVNSAIVSNRRTRTYAISGSVFLMFRKALLIWKRILSNQQYCSHTQTSVTFFNDEDHTQSMSHQKSAWKRKIVKSYVSCFTDIDKKKWPEDSCPS